MKIITFKKVSEPYGWLGNMSPFKLTYGDKLWRTAEALFQALRFAEDDSTRNRIWEAKSPMTAKMVSKQFAGFYAIPPRETQDVANMRMILKLKLDQHPKLAAELKTFQGTTIIEDCTARRSPTSLFWGAAWDASLQGWVGNNMLGKLWMELT
jgi:predicted NAD-dependent protein-ADP-ribosyltransferase YbiA (DUF1768 family)